MIEDRLHRLDGAQRLPHLLEQRFLQHRGVRSRFVAVSLKISQPPKTRSSEPASGTKSLIFGLRPSVRFPKPDGAQLRERSDGLRRGRVSPLPPLP